MKWIKENEEVLYPEEPQKLVTMSRKDLDCLEKVARSSARRRSRICAHTSVEDDIHEMMIYHPKGTYVRPHKHLNKDESFHLISGKIDLVMFDEGGNVVEVLRMGGYTSGKTFYYRISSDNFHTQIFWKDTIFHEVTKGPFDKKDTIAADWAPEEKNRVSVEDFLKILITTINEKNHS